MPQQLIKEFTSNLVLSDFFAMSCFHILPSPSCKCEARQPHFEAVPKDWDQNFDIKSLFEPAYFFLKENPTTSPRSTFALHRSFIWMENKKAQLPMPVWQFLPDEESNSTFYCQAR